MSDAGGDGDEANRDDADDTQPDNSGAQGNEGETSTEDTDGRANSPVWQGAEPWRGQTRSNGKRSRKREYYEWDHTHGDIEVYDHRGKHKGSMDPVTGQMTKGPVPGRKIDIR